MRSGLRAIIWGSAGHGMVLADVIALAGGSVEAVVDNDPLARCCVAGADLLIGEAQLSQWLAGRAGAAGRAGFVAIGGARGADRRAIARRLQGLGLPLPRAVHPSAVVATSASIGDGAHVLAQAVVGAGAKVGDCVIVNTGATVDHECVLAAGVHIAPGAVLCGCIEVGEDALVGAGAVVLPRLRIGARAVVGAGAVVTRDVPDGAIVMGQPARDRGGPSR